MICLKCRHEPLFIFNIAGHSIKSTRYLKAVIICKEKYPWDYLLYKTLRKLYFSNHKWARIKYPKLQNFLEG